jgi:hypothetical protein
MNISVKDIAVISNVSPRQVQRWISEGYQGHKLPAQRTGKRFVVSDTDYALWLIATGLDQPEPAVGAVVQPIPQAEPESTPRVDTPWPPYPQPADPHGVLTNAPHERSSNWPHPAACEQYMKNEARKLAEKYRGKPDETN